MIQKYLRLQTSPDHLRHELLTFEAWHEWWPGVQKVQVVQHKLERSVIDFEIRSLTTIHMTLEFDHSDAQVIIFRQLKGKFKSYSGDWTILPVQDSDDIILRIRIAFDPGMLLPKGIVYTKFSENLTALEAALHRRLREKYPEGHSQKAPTVRPESIARYEKPANADPTLAHVFPTKKGLEVWVSGKRYILKSLA